MIISGFSQKKIIFIIFFHFYVTLFYFFNSLIRSQYMSSLENEFLDRLEKHKGVIFKISKMYMDNTEDQSDLFQEITYQAWKSYTSFEGKSEFSTWLYRIALNTAIVFLRTEKKRSFIRNEEINHIRTTYEDYNHEQEEQLKKDVQCYPSVKFS